DGYREVGIDGRLYKAHRVIWLYIAGEWPDEIDHINGDRSDNRFANLRAVSRAENMRNKRSYKNNRSGQNGVSWHNQDRRWIAYITINGKFKRLGGFINKDDAIAARLKAEAEYGLFQKRHG